MTEGNQPTEADLWFMAAAFAWVAFCIGASVLYRQSRGLPFFSKAPATARFVERWASGSSQRHILARLGGASNCLFVAVTSEHLIVRPQFPFNLIFLPEIFDLEHVVPLTNIRSIEEVSFLFTSLVKIKFVPGSGPLQSITLHLRNRQSFLNALRAS